MTGVQRVIYKYPFPEDDGPLSVPWCPSSRILHVEAQPSSATLPTLWIEQPYLVDHEGEAEQPRGERLFIIVPTGEPYAPDSVQEFVGTAVCFNGALVWHVFAETVEVAF